MATKPRKSPAKRPAPTKARAPAKARAAAKSPAPARARAPGKARAAAKSPAPAKARAPAKTAALPRAPGLPPGLLPFLAELAANNDRGWFEANRERYERDVRAPLLGFIRDFAPRLAKLSRRFVADPRPVGGSMFRIHRDTRFAKDKSPYKTHAGVFFRHEAASDVHAPGYYLHLEPGASMIGVGIWHPPAEALQAIRGALLENGGAYARSVESEAFLAAWSLGGESLARPPRGFPKDHPRIAEIQRKDFVAMAALTDREVTSADLAERIAERYAAAGPYMKFLTGALGLPF